MPGDYRKDRGGRKRLTAQKRKEIKEAFDLFDTDGSGTSGIHAEFSCRRILLWEFLLLFPCVRACMLQAPLIPGS